jgi:hypothetical protein
MKLRIISAVAISAALCLSAATAFAGKCPTLAEFNSYLLQHADFASIPLKVVSQGVSWNGGSGSGTEEVGLVRVAILFR